jgi:hypothetical protein
VAATSVPCLHLAQGFDNGDKLFKAAEQYGLEDVEARDLGLPVGTRLFGDRELQPAIRTGVSSRAMVSKITFSWSAVSAV